VVFVRSVTLDPESERSTAAVADFIPFHPAVERYGATVPQFETALEGIKYSHIQI
jgi:hypothetical protein